MSTSPSEAAVEPVEHGPAPVAADYFDGHRSKAWRVALSFRAATLSTIGEGVERHDHVSTLRVSEPMGNAPRLVTFPDGAHCEIRDHEAFAALLAAGGHADGWVVRLQSRWRWAAASVVLTLATLVAGYLWGLPALADAMAARVPNSIVARIGQDAVEFLDRGVFAPTNLPEARRQALGDEFGRMVTPGHARPPYRVLFRNGGRAGANALALPDGTIIVTDQLVALAGHDEEILGVMAHELGHVRHRHGLRLMIQSSIVGFAVAWILGDVSSVAAGLPSVLLEARYSREHELEADRYAADMLEANGLSPSRLATLLERLEESHSDPHAAGRPPSDPGGHVADERTLSDYVASHPATRERIDALSRSRPR
jgi:Zn-dependent protease with chaperone function